MPVRLFGCRGLRASPLIQKDVCGMLLPSPPLLKMQFFLMYFKDDVLAADGYWKFSSESPKTWNN